MHLFRNESPVRGDSIPPAYAATFGRDAPRAAREFFDALGSFAPTPLLDLDGLAAALGIAKIFYKDEGRRLGLQSFKALGGSYAVARLVQRHLEAQSGQRIEIAALLGGQFKSQTAGFTVACATDGNHGRSVAWGAQLLGCPCVIFLHEHVSTAREAAIAEFGARIVRVRGVYDDSCVEATRASLQNGWHVVADFASRPFDVATSFVMQGYTIMVDEIIRALDARRERPTHLFVQGGCGGLAAAVSGHLAAIEWPISTLVVVEPERANCLLRSAQRGRIAKMAATEATCMSMLECYEPSHMAWPVLERTIDFFMDIPDDEALATSRRVQRAVALDPLIHAGPSGVAGLAGLISACACRQSAEMLGLSANSRVLIIGSEGAIN